MQVRVHYLISSMLFVYPCLYCKNFHRKKKSRTNRIAAGHVDSSNWFITKCRASSLHKLQQGGQMFPMNWCISIKSGSFVATNYSPLASSQDDFFFIWVTRLRFVLVVYGEEPSSRVRIPYSWKYCLGIVNLPNWQFCQNTATLNSLYISLFLSPCDWNFVHLNLTTMPCAFIPYIHKVQQVNKRLKIMQWKPQRKGAESTTIC